MTKFKYEMHVHTQQGSECGRNTGAEMVDCLKRRGYDGCVITDHFFTGNSRVKPGLNGLSWLDAVNSFCSGYEDAKKRGDELDFRVFFGFEYAFRGTEFLIYGADKNWLIGNPQIMELDLKPVLEKFRNDGFFVVHAHPFRERSYIDKIRLLPDYTDAVEVLNLGNTVVQNQRAQDYALKFGLPESAGGDLHDIFSETSGIETGERIESIGDLAKTIKSGSFSIIRP